MAHHDYILGLRTSPSDTTGFPVPTSLACSTMHTSSTEITLSDPHAWHASAMPPPTSTEDNAVIAPWLADPPSPHPKRTNFGLASVKVMNRQGSSSNVFTRPRASESTLAESFHSASTSDSQRTPISKGFLKAIKRSLSRPNLNKQTYDEPPGPPPTVVFSHDTSSTYSFYTPPSPPPPSKKPRRSHKQKSNAALPRSSKDLLPGLPDGASMERILNVPVRDIVHPSALEDSSYGSLTSTDTTSSPTFEDFGPETVWKSRYSNDLTPPFTNPFPKSSSVVSLVSRRKAVPEPLRVPPTAALLLPVAQEPQQPRRLGSAESTALNDDPASWTAPESWAVPKEGDEPEAPDYTSSEDEESRNSVAHSALTSLKTKSQGSPEGKAPPPPRKGSQAKVSSIPVSLIFTP